MDAKHELSDLRQTRGGSFLLPSQNMTVAAGGDGRKENLWASDIAGGNSAPVLQSPEHDLDPVATFVTPLVVFDGLSARSMAGNAGHFPVTFNAFLNQSSLVGSLGSVALTGSTAAVGQHGARLLSMLD